MRPTMRIGDRVVGGDHPTYVIAELSANHHHDYDAAVALVRAAKECGADAVKLQTYTPDTMTIDSDEPPFRIGEGTVWEGRSLYELYAEASTPWEWHESLRDEAARLGMHLFSTPFDETAVEFLEKLDVPVHKVASFELVDLPLIERIARTGKPMIVSTGMATLEEISAAVRTARAAGAMDIALLRCNSAYPAPPHEMDLRTIPHLGEAFGTPVGLSDHTLGVAAAVTAVALGARLLEKHITLSRDRPGPDSSFSLEPDEFAVMVKAVREAEASLGTVRYGPTSAERPSLEFRRSLYVVADVAEGEVFTADNVRAIRPGGGLPPGEIGNVLGRRAARAVGRGKPVTWDVVGAPAAGDVTGR